MEGDRRIVTPVGVQIGRVIDRPLAVGAALKRAGAVFVEWDRRTRLRLPAGRQRERGKQQQAFYRHVTGLGIG